MRHVLCRFSLGKTEGDWGGGGGEERGGPGRKKTGRDPNRRLHWRKKESTCPQKEKAAEKSPFSHIRQENQNRNFEETKEKHHGTAAIAKKRGEGGKESAAPGGVEEPYQKGEGGREISKRVARGLKDRKGGRKRALI